MGAADHGGGRDGTAVPVSPPPAAGVCEARVRRSEERGGGVPPGWPPHGFPPQSVGREPRQTASAPPADRKPRSCDHLSRAVPRLFRLRGIRFRHAQNDAAGVRLYAEAKRFAACRYSVVEVSPISAQQNAPRRGRYEKRRITERESWDALNETWGVFVGWAIWNKLETTDQVNPATRWDWDTVAEYLDRLETAYVNRELTGYFEPANQAERRGIPRWYMGPSHAISAHEIALLLEVILDETPGMAQVAARWISASQDQTTVLTLGVC